MVLISSLYPDWDARSWLDKVHDAWMLLGLALGWPLATPLPGPGWPLAWPWAGPWPGPWLALGLALGWPLAGPSWPGSNLEIKLTGSPGKITGSGLLSIAQAKAKNTIIRVLIN